MKQSVLNNAAYLIAAFIGQKFFSFIFFTLIARQAGVEITGAYIFAFSYTSFFAVFIDIGFSSFLIREIARSREQAQKLLSTILAAKIGFSVLTAVVVLFSLPFLHKSSQINHMVYVSVLVMILDSFTLTFWGVFRGLQNLKYEGLHVVIGQVVILITGLTALALRLPPFYLVMAVMTGSLYQFCVSLYLVGKRAQFSLKPIIDRSHLRQIFRISYPFALSLILTRFYTYFDQIYLSLIKGERDLGIYGVPYKLTFALQFIPGAIGSALFPAMSDYFVNDRGKLADLFERSMFYLMIIGLPAAAIIAVIAPQIITHVYGPQYFASVLSLRIMMISVPFIFMAFPVGALLNASNHQARHSLNIFFTLLTNVIANFLLTPKYSYIGASLAIVLSMAVLFFSDLMKVNQIMDYRKTYLLLSFGKGFLAAGIGALASWFASGLYNGLVYDLAVLPAVGIIVYFVAMLVFKAFTRKDLDQIRFLIAKRT